MDNLTSNQTIDEAIALLKIKSDNQFIDLKQKFNIMLESIKPLNIIKETLHEVSASSEIKDGIERTAVGIASGLLVKKVMYRNSDTTLKKLANIALQVLVPYLIAKNYDKIKLLGMKLVDVLPSILKKK